MRKLDKASLRKITLDEEIQSPNKNFTGTYVLIRNYELACIVIDGYDDGLSLKSTEHQRTMMKNGSSRSVVICEENESPYTKGRFLSNTHFFPPN